MNRKSICYIGAFIMCINLFYAANVFAADSIDTIARVIINMEHYPSTEDKKKLSKILESTSASKDEKIIAASLKNMSHYLSDIDKQQLQQLSESNTASVDVKLLSKIILDFNHTASSEQKRFLKTLTH